MNSNPSTTNSANGDADGSSNVPPPPPPLPSGTEVMSNERQTYWRIAADSIQSATETTYSGLASLVSSIYQDKRKSSSSLYSVQSSPSFVSHGSQTDEDQVLGSSPRFRRARRATAPDLKQLMENPYNSVRGRHSQRTSQSAVRSLLTLVPVMGNGESYATRSNSQLETLPEDSEVGGDLTETNDDPSRLSDLERSWNDDGKRRNVSDSETASQLAEGTIRALRDLCLDEAGDLHASLRFWTHRWERPVLSWIEAGPSGMS